MKAKEQIKEFLEPDKFWDILGIKSQEDFINKIITKGRFHKNVPEKIKNDYKIVERLLFFSYYNYPIIDEAFGKLTRIFEASINLKIEELKIEKKGFESLNSKIKRLEKYSSNELHKEWLHSKNLRNTFAHHKAGRLMGIILINTFKHIINMINSVFLTKNEILELENSLKLIKQKTNHLEEGLFIMEYKGKSFLIWSIIAYTSIIKNGIEKSFWVFHPVYQRKTIEKISDFPNPFLLNLKKIKINPNGFIAEVIESKEIIKIQKTDNKTNQEKYFEHKFQMRNIDLKLKENYWFFLESELKKGVSEFIYNYTWE
ncbi:hypothetical protein LPB136_06780 [Tenacibaculum todarodis]|uniref:Uncharacterized protein n=1 Tax=Tenacibaculum todarodis TaxID=1850252 RepID=A0A1L3JIV1_9FLAO|nr:hypothetical protein [Tenacibaculum todarodis]APG65070.1 hypothetical protein LPB136_06780 [Tenacibaculum todarodis]